MSELQTKNSAAGSMALLVTALIWGLAFSAQRQAAAYLDAISFNTLRFALGALTLFLIMLAFDFVKKRTGRRVKKWNKSAIVGGVICGIILFLGNNLQQIGVESTSAGKAGFITSLYIVFVPLFGLLAGRRTGATGWFAVVIAVAGFWTMSITSALSVTMGDIMVLLCSFIFAFHILFIDIFAPDSDPIKLTLMQFVTAALISLPFLAVNGLPTAEAIEKCVPSILFVGILSAGIGFGLQTVGQQRTEPALATLLMSLESVFSLVGGLIILNESYTVKELVGCLLVFVAVFLAEIKPRNVYLSAPRSPFIRKYGNFLHCRG